MLRHPIVIDNNKLRPSNRCDGPRPIPVPMWWQCQSPIIGPTEGRRGWGQ
jgi:hypothetical protein